MGDGSTCFLYAGRPSYEVSCGPSTNFANRTRNFRPFESCVGDVVYHGRHDPMGRSWGVAIVTGLFLSWEYPW